MEFDTYTDKHKRTDKALFLKLTLVLRIDHVNTRETVTYVILSTELNAAVLEVYLLQQCNVLNSHNYDWAWNIR